MKSYGKAIKALRKKANMTQAQLAEKMNVAYQTVSKWENDVNLPDISVVESLCALFSVSMDEFMTIANYAKSFGPVISEPPPVVGAKLADGGDADAALRATDMPQANGGAAADTRQEVGPQDASADCGEPTCSDENGGSALGDNAHSGTAARDTAQTAVRPRITPEQARREARNRKIATALSVSAVAAVIVFFAIFIPLFMKSRSDGRHESAPHVYVFSGGSGAVGQMPDISVKGENGIKLPQNTFVRPGYTFDGWEYGGKTYAVGEVLAVAADVYSVNVTAKWKPISYNVSFVYEGVSDKTSYVYGVSYKLPSVKFERVGYTQTGWAYNGQDYLPGASVINLSTGADVEFTPLWTPIEYTMIIDYGSFEINFDGVEYTGAPLEIKCEYGSDPLADRKISSYLLDFIGWTYYSADGSEYTGDPKYINPDPSVAVTASPRWRSTRYNLYVRASDGSADYLQVVNLTGTEEWTLPLAEELFADSIPEGYRFSHWAMDVGRKTFADGETVSDLMLYGFWYGGDMFMGTTAYVNIYPVWEPIG